MPESSHSREHILAEAARKTGDYQWMEAATLYDQALGLGIEAISEQARVTASMAKCYFEGAFQADTRDSFKSRMGQAQTAYEKARELYYDAGLEPRSKTSWARGLFAEYWIKDSSDERKELIQNAISTVEDAVRALKTGGETSTLADAEKDLLTYHLEFLPFNLNFTDIREETAKMAEAAENAIVLYRNLDPTSLLECMSIAFLVSVTSHGELGIGSRAEVFENAQRREREMREIAEKLGKPYPRFLSAEASALISHVLKGDFSASLKAAEEALGHAQRTGDKSLIGRATSWIAFSSFWKGIGEEDSESRRESFERSEREALKAIEILKVPLMKQVLSQALEVYAESNTVTAITVETEPSAKKERLHKAIGVSRLGMKGETDPGVLGTLSHSLSKALLFLATLDVGPEEKSELLQESLHLRQEVVRIADSKLAPNTWDQGVSRNYLALVKAELASVHKDNNTKVELLESACIDMQKCLSICSTSPTPGQLPVIAQYAEWFGDVAVKLLQLTTSSEASHRATTGYETAIDINVKIGHLASVPNIRWKLASAYDQSGQYAEASREFQLAAEAYRAGANKLAACESCFTDNAFYMEAWSLIEHARLHHGEEQYLLAAEEYQKAAEVLKRTTQWAPLTKHYLGCSYLEGGEALARQERPDSSRESFRTAVAAFQESKTQLGDLLKNEQDQERIKELKDWAQLNSGREKYCLARIHLEEAKLLDKTGEKEASSSKYRSASASFKALREEAENEQAKSELGTLGLLCEAWAKMKEAEANASPELYASAAEIFLATEKTTRREKLRVLAMANASICKALEAGTRFRRTRNTDLYGEIKKQLEASADYYREAGFKNAADWTRATQRMFDALVYLTEAEVERDPRKKTEHYHLAEKNLQLAARLYGDSGFQAKKDEALAHLERAKEEKALLLSPLDALAGNPVDSAASVLPVSVVRDQAVGLERFEEASVVGSIRVPGSDFGVGSDITVELELANVGKTAATLMKLENVSGEGLELDAQKAQLKVEGNFVDLKGKRLEYMKTHELKIPLKARKKGLYRLSPRIMFVDERGNYKSFEFEPVALSVRELGISGWLKGPK